MADEGGTTTAPAGTTPTAAISSDPAPAAVTAPSAFDWGKAGLAPEQLNLVTERGWKSPADVMISYRHLETATGVPPERLIKLPSAKDAANPEAWNKIYTQLGRPETADKYAVPVPEGDKGEFAGLVKPMFHKAGLSQSQVTQISEWWNGHQAEQQKAEQTQLDQRNLTDVSQLKQAWGSEFDARASIVDRAAETFGMNQAQLDALKQTLGPKQAMEFLYNIGSKVAVEDSAVPGINGKDGFGVTPESAQSMITQKRADPTFAAMFNSKDPKQRADARAEMDRLVKIAYPGVTPFGSQAVTR